MKNVSLVTFCPFLSDLFDVLSKLSFQIQRNDLILPSAMAHLEEALSSISLLAKRPVRGGRLQALLNSLSTSGSCSLFEGVTLSGDLRGVTIDKIDEKAGVGATDLCLSGLRERFHALLQAPNKTSSSRPNQVV